MTCLSCLLMCQYPVVLQQAPPLLEQVCTAVNSKTRSKKVPLHVDAYNVPGSVSLQHLLMLMQEMMQVMSMTLKGGGQA